MLALKRTLTEAFKNVTRDVWLGLAAVGIIALSLYVVSVLFVLTRSVDDILKNVENKVSVSVYFKPDVAESAILSAKNELLAGNKNISSVEYISKDQALENFKKDSTNEPIITQSLEAIGDNPLWASLVIKANDTGQYQAIVDSIPQTNFAEQVSRVNYNKNKDMIDKLNVSVATIRRMGLVLALVYALISALIIFNTIRVTIYTQRREIEIMRLVGASNGYIRTPFILEGIIYGFIAIPVTAIFLLVTFKFVTAQVFSNIFFTLFPMKNLFYFYLSGFWQLLLIQIGIVVFLGVVSSWVAMRKYLKV